MCSGEEGTGIFEMLDFIKSQVPEKLKKELNERKKDRTAKFENLISKIKA